MSCAISLVEYVLPLEACNISENYFSSAGRKNTTFLGGQKIKREDSLEEIKKNIGDFIHPVVHTSELAEVIDLYIIKQLGKKWNELKPYTPARALSWRWSRLSLSQTEKALLNSEIDQFASDVPNPGELREAQLRLPSSRLQIALRSTYDPMITPEEIQAVQTAMKIRRMQKSCELFISPSLQFLQLKEFLAKLPSEYRDHFADISHLLQKRIDVFSVLRRPEFNEMRIIEFVLGEELYKRIFDVLPISWWLPAEKVSALRDLIQSQLQDLQGGLKESHYYKNKLAGEKILNEFREEKNHFFSEEVLTRILFFTKTAFSDQFYAKKIKPSVNCQAESSDKLDRFLQSLSTLSDKEREAFGDRLADAKTDSEKLEIFRKYNPTGLQFDLKEEESFIEQIEISTSKCCKILLSPFEELCRSFRN